MSAFALRIQLAVPFAVLWLCLLISVVGPTAAMAQPPNDNFASAIVLTGADGSTTGTNVGATKEPGEPQHTFFSGGRSVWWRWVAPETDYYVFSTCRSNFDAAVAIYTGSSVSNLVEVPDAFGFSSASCFNGNRKIFLASAGATYRIAVDGEGITPSTGAITLDWERQAPNDNFAEASPLVGSSGNVVVSNVLATDEFGEPAHGGAFGFANASLWWVWTAPSSEEFIFETCGSDHDTLLSIYTGTTLSSLVEVAANDNACGYQISDWTGTSSVSLNSLAGTVYYVAVDAKYSTELGSVNLAWRRPNRPPNDNFADSIALGDAPGTISGTNVEASREDGEPSHAGESLDLSVWYRWTATRTGFSTFSVQGFHTVAAYSGNSIASLVPVGDAARSTTFLAYRGETYSIAVTSSAADPGRAFILSWDSDLDPLRTLGLGTLQDGTISPDGRRIATGGGGGAFVWDFDTGEVLRRLDGHSDIVTSVSFSPDSGMLATASQDSTAAVWDLATGTVVLRLSGHTDWINAIAYSPDGQRIATASRDGTARLWDSATGEELFRLERPGADVYCLDFSNDGARLVTGELERFSFGAAACIWDAVGGGLLTALEVPGSANNVYAIDLSSDGERLLAITGGGPRLWDIATGELQDCLNGLGNSGGLSGRFLPGDDRIVTHAYGLGLRVWDLETCTFAGQMSGTPFYVKQVSFTPSGDSLLSASWGTRLDLWNIADGKLLRTYEGHSPWVSATATSPDGGRSLTGSSDNLARLWDMVVGAETRKLVGHTEPVNAVAWFPSQNRIATGSGFLFGQTPNKDDSARVWDVETGEELLQLVGHTEGVTSLAVSSDESQLVTASADNTARLWDSDSGEQLRTFPHGNKVTHVEFTNGGARVLTGCADGLSRLWDAVLATQVRSFAGVPGTAAPGGQQVATSNSGVPTIWNLETGAVIKTLPGQSGTVNALAYSPDDSLLISGSSDHSARIWDVSTGELLRTFRRHAGGVTTVAILPGNAQALTGSEDGTLRLFELAPPRAIVVAGGGPYAGNSIARQTHELGVYAYRTLLARGYAAEDVLFLDAFPDGHVFSQGVAPVDWDVDGDGTDDVDGLATRAALKGALEGPFARDAGRLLLLMMDHGYRTNDFMAFRLNENEAISTVEMNGLLDDLQIAAPVDVTLAVDSCYSGRFVADCKKTDAIPAERGRIVVASTSEFAEAVFLPAPDLTSFMYTFLGSAYMGNSMGEAFRSGARFFDVFPVAGQEPVLHDGEVQTTGTETKTALANRQFFGASWAYGVQADNNINNFFPAFATVAPSGQIAPGQPVTVTATLLPYQSPRRLKVVVKPPAEQAVSGEPVTGLPTFILDEPTDGTLAEGIVYSRTFLPADPDNPFFDEGAYRLTFTAEFENFRLSDPEDTSLLVSDDPDPDETEIRAVLAFDSDADPTIGNALALAGDFAYASYLDKFQDAAGIKHPEWIDYLTNNESTVPRNTIRREEVAVLEAERTRTGARVPLSKAGCLAAISSMGTEAGRLYVHIASPDATNGALGLAGETLTAVELDDALDAVQGAPHSPEVIVVIDGAGSGSFLVQLAATGEQRRLVVTSARADQCALFLDDPAVTFTHKLLTPLWGGQTYAEAVNAAEGFFTGFVGEFIGTRLQPQLDDVVLARSRWLGRRYAFAGSAASGLPFVVSGEVILGGPGEPATLRATLMEGVEPVEDPAVPGDPDLLDNYRVYAEVALNGVSCGLGSEALPRFRLRRDAPDAWTWSAEVSAASLPPEFQEGRFPVTFIAEYPDDKGTGRTRPTEPVFGTLVVGDPTGSAADSYEPADNLLETATFLPADVPLPQSHTIHETLDQDWFSLYVNSVAATGAVAPIPHTLEISGAQIPEGTQLQVSMFLDGLPGECVTDGETLCQLVSAPGEQIPFLTKGNAPYQYIAVRVALVGEAVDPGAPVTYEIALSRSTGANNPIVGSIGTGVERKFASIEMSTDQYFNGSPGLSYSTASSISLYRSLDFANWTKVAEWDTSGPPCTSCRTISLGNGISYAPDNCIAFEDGAIGAMGLAEGQPVFYEVRVSKDGVEVPVHAVSGYPIVAPYRGAEPIDPSPCVGRPSDLPGVGWIAR